MSWDPTTEAWQYRLLDKLPPGIDRVQLERSLRMSFTERMEAVRKMIDLAQEMRAARDRLSSAR